MTACFSHNSHFRFSSVLIFCPSLSCCPVPPAFAMSRDTANFPVQRKGWNWDAKIDQKRPWQDLFSPPAVVGRHATTPAPKQGRAGRPQIVFSRPETDLVAPTISPCLGKFCAKITWGKTAYLYIFTTGFDNFSIFCTLNLPLFVPSI